MCCLLQVKDRQDTDKLDESREISMDMHTLTSHSTMIAKKQRVAALIFNYNLINCDTDYDADDEEMEMASQPFSIMAPRKELIDEDCEKDEVCAVSW